MAFNTKEQEIIKWGLDNGKTKEEVSRAISNYRMGIVSKPKEKERPTFGEEIKSDLDTRVERTGEILKREDTGTVEKGVQLFGQGAGLAANIIEKTAEQIPGVKKGIEAIGSGIRWLSETTPIKAIGEKIGGTKTVQELTNLYDTDSNFKDTVDAVANIARLGGDVDLIMSSPMFIKNVTNKVAEKTLGAIPPPGAASDLVAGLGEKVSNISPKSPDIMNRVARLNPKEFETFKKISGKTPGEYLTETGNFKAPDGIIQTEGKKFIETIAKKDAELAKLPGTFKDGSISDALEGLLERAKATSGTKTKSPFLNQVLEWQSKLDDVGLTMDEINKLKRLYEREVKLGYNKLTNADKVQQATNIDSALRKFQDKTAKDLGFTNLGEINKQIQISKYLADKLGDKIVGQSGLNGVSITDWIILAGGDPTAVASFLTKKFFSSKGVQAKIAELLNKEGVTGLVSPEITTTPMSIERTISPTGAKQLPVGTSKTVENRVPIELRGKFEMEKGVPKTSMKSTQLKSKTKSRKASPNSTTKSLKGKGTIPENSLIQEAKKYKSAEDFVKAQGETVFRGGDTAIDTSRGGGRGISVSDKETAGLFTPPKGGVVDEAILPKTAKILKEGDIPKNLQDAYIKEAKVLADPNNFSSTLQKSVIEKQQAIIDYARKNGFDAVEFPFEKEIRVVKPNVLKTKSQLEEIWKKANKK